MKLQIFIGKVVLTAVMLWILLCAVLFVLKETGAIDPPYWPSTIDTTLFILTLVGAVYSIIKLNEWIVEAGDEIDLEEQGERSDSAAR